MNKIIRRHVVGCTVIALSLLSSCVAMARDDKDVALAVANGDRAYNLEQMLKQGANPNVHDALRGETPLMIAVRENAVKSFKVLLNTKSVDLNARARNGDTAMMLAALEGRTEMVKALLDKDAEPNNTGWTALHYAALNGHDDIVKLLIDASAYIDAESPNKTTPLMIAAHGGHITTVKLLLDEGADLSIKNEKGLTAIDYAVSAEHEDIATGLRNRLRQGHTDVSSAAAPAARPNIDPALPQLTTPALR